MTVTNAPKTMAQAFLAGIASTGLEVSIKAAKPTAWVITTGQASQYTFEVDQIVGSEREARKELKDLKAMGFEDAKVRPFGSWAEAEDFQDRVREACGGPFRPATKR